MSDESTQLSVAELLARNGQGVPTTGGGRRRRSGRGIAVTDLTGDLPPAPEGSSAHAAPEPEDPAPPVPPFPLSTNVEPAHSPLSGPISFYDPLGQNGASAPATPSYDPPAYEPPAFEARSYSPPALPDPAPRADSTELGWPPSPAAQAPTGGRRARRERLEALAAQAGDQVSVADLAGATPGSDTGRAGRRRRRDSDEETTEVRPYRGPLPQNDNAGPPTAAWAPARAPEVSPRAPLPPEPAPRAPFSPEPPARRERGFDRGERGFERPDRGADRADRGVDRAERGDAPPQNGRRNGADGPPPPGLPAWSARRQKPPEPANSDRPARNGRPAPEDSAGAATAVWSLANRDQQLLAGPTVAGDLLRDANERGDRRGGPGPRPGERGSRRGGADLLEETEHRTELLRPLAPEREKAEGDEAEQPAPRRSGRSVPSRRSRAARKAEEDANRKQWMILGGQAAGAAVAGMLLFKGFEKMWDLLPFVALMLAMVVILGLVALVRVLRRTDDIFSTVIAVVVGIFVTLGPLAFLLSTN
ncbi:hypothetical protein NDR87_25825 [Nocardia sp. CDC159]|uniref:Uncharacterized protein n=1 Tax=Nocardia pulmonis TaxID=2951408 RepID=A0A9X2IYD5_9NOCA|nr:MULTISPECIES: hypothetical protein [Nocardia]MCM6774865.1 hypothetical protein [Nocardia pulmonis]MCM6789796.1 hypothetical protein [Nocardia sp. CDC159]